MSTARGEDFERRVVTDRTQLEAARGIIRRMAPRIESCVVLEIIPAAANGRDVFELESIGGRLVLRGSTGVAVASAFNHYLKNCCKCHISWCGDQLALPAALPAVPQKIRVVCPHKYRVFFNYCTLSYSGAFWDWDRWQREIDQLAMQGINMPLSVIGLEGAWYHTLLRYGFSDQEARKFLVGPCYFAWQWMTNIQSHGGPLPKKWIEQRIALGQKILRRQLDLGMMPIQQGFSGFVPVELREKYPGADITIKRGWAGFEGTAQLDPLDPLFKEFGKTFFEENLRLFGASHYYAADPFHEGSPPKPGDVYLEKVGRGICDLMLGADPEGKWVMQSWSMRKPVACAVPKDRLLILDLNGRASGFWGYEFVKGQVHNYGNRVNLHGDLHWLASNPFAKAAASNSECVGMGWFMEGIEHNPVYYEMGFDMIWRDGPVEAVEWLSEYARRRYGAQSDNAAAAWEILLAGPYRRGTNLYGDNGSIMAARPALDVKKSAPNDVLNIPYDPRSLYDAWGLLLKDCDRLEGSAGYVFDVVDVGRQVLSNLAQEIHEDAAVAFKLKDRGTYAASTAKFLRLLDDVDALLSTGGVLNFGTFVKSARRCGDTPEEQMYYEWNANMLVTIWGPATTPLIFDYSWREWAGLISKYYKPRWRKFYDHLAAQLARGADYADPVGPDRTSYGRPSFRSNDFYSALGDWEMAWTKARHDVPLEPTGDGVGLARQLFARYKPLVSYAYSPGRGAKVTAFKLRGMTGEYGKAVGEWKTSSRDWEEIVIDVADHLVGDGTYQAAFAYAKGNRLDIRWVALLKNETEIARDTHDGSTHSRGHVNNVYSLDLADYSWGNSYALKLSARTVGYAADSCGIIWLKKAGRSGAAAAD